MTALIIALVIGAIAGWLAGLLVQGTGFGLVGDIVVGILGALIAGLPVSLLRYSTYAWGRRARRDHPRFHRGSDPARDRAGDKADHLAVPRREGRRRLGPDSEVIPPNSR